MVASLLQNGKQTFLDANGNPIVSGSVQFFVPLTTTPKDTWQDPAQTILNSNPVVLDSAGSALIYGLGSYRQIVKDVDGNLIWDQLTAAYATSDQGALAANALQNASPLLAPNDLRVGSSLYPTKITGVSSRYNSTSFQRSNTLGSKNLLVGAASVDGPTWVETYMPGTDAVGRVSLYNIAAPGNGYAAVDALRGSDFPGTTPDFLIASISVMVADNAAVAHTYWNKYDHGIIPATGLFAAFYNEEKSLQNLAASAAVLDPFNAAVGGDRTRVATNLHLTSGINAAVASNLVSAGIDISSNGGRYRKGIVVAADALDTSGGTADAFAMAINHALTWYISDGAGHGTAIWKMFNNSGSGTLSQIILGTNNFWVAAADIAVTGGRKLGLVPDASIGFRFNAANGHVELVRPDGTIIAFWVV